MEIIWSIKNKQAKAVSPSPCMQILFYAETAWASPMSSTCEGLGAPRPKTNPEAYSQAAAGR